MKKSNSVSRLFNESSRFERPFFFFLTLIMAGMYVWALAGSPVLNTSWKIATFTLLMIAHVVLYWLSPLVFGHRQWLAIYLIIQGGLAFSMGMMCQVLGIVFGLYPGLIGLMIGIPVKRAWKILAIVYILVLSLSNFLLLTGSKAMVYWLLGTVPVVIFVAMYVSMYLRQVEAREQAQALLKDLEAANRQLSEYAARVEDLTMSNERQRMARELHDTLSQGLAGLILQLEAVDAHLAGNRPERARSILEQSMVTARKTLAEARQAIDNLRQPAERDLVEAVRQEAERFTRASGIPCEPQVDVRVEIPELVAETAIRAISEGLTNIARHARAKHVTLLLTGAGKELGVELSDDGVGFDPEAFQAGHYGLLGMRERIRLAGGTFDVKSGPGMGTQIGIRFPLEVPVHA